MIVSIPDLCTLTYFYLTEDLWEVSDLPLVQNKDCQYSVSYLRGSSNK